MEIAKLMAVISPFLPSLLKTHGQKIDIPTVAAQTAQAIWEKLGSKIATQ
jgi:hypothetical protein